MAQQVESLLHKPEDLSSVPLKEKSSSTKLSPDLRAHTVVCSFPHVHHTHGNNE